MAPEEPDPDEAGAGRTMPTRREGVARPPERASGAVFDPPAVRFVERDELGRGGMGRVVAAVDRSLARTVAIKHALTGDPVDLLRFEREVRITARLQHPNIVQILDAGRDPDGRPYYVMSMVRGRPLSKLVDLATGVPDRLALITHVASAVEAAAYAHAQGVIHRDIKPWNIMVGDFGETLLIDWGLARELGEADDDPTTADTRDAIGLTRAGKAFGTPGFMAPEQARGESPDPRVDVYALGATLYHVLRGEPPLAGTSESAAIEAAAANVRPELDKLDEVPAELATIVGKAMAPARDDRYADAAALAVDLRRFLAGQLVSAHRYTVRQRISRFVRKHRIAVAVATVSAIAMIAFGLIAVHNIVEERDVAQMARDEAEAATRLADDRRDDELLGRAQALISTDPTLAVAVLKHLPAASERWPQARAIAAAAVASGVAHGYHAHDGWIANLEFSADGRQLLSAGRDDGTVAIHDIASGETRIVAHLGTAVREAIWTSPHGVAVAAADHGVHAIDLATGTDTLLAPRVTIGDLAVVRGRLLARTSDAAMIDVAAPSVVIAHEVISLHRAPTFVLAITRDGLSWYDGDRLVDVLANNSLAYALVAVSDAGRRFAVQSGDDVWEYLVTATGPVAAGHWNYRGMLNGGTSVFYTGDRLTVMDARFRWWTLLPDGKREEIDLPATVHEGPTRGGELFGDIDVATPDDTFRIPHRVIGITKVTGHRGTPWVAAAIDSGDVQLWNLETLHTPRISIGWLPTLIDAVALDGDILWVRDLQQVSRIDLGHEQVTAYPAPNQPQLCLPAAHTRLVTFDPSRRHVDVFEPGGQRRARHDNMVALGCSGGPSVVIASDGRVLELSRDDPDHPREVAKIPDAHEIAASTRWLAVATRDRLVRLDRKTGQTVELAFAGASELVADPAGKRNIDRMTFAVDEQGVVYAENTEGLSRWDGTSKKTYPAIRQVFSIFPRPGGGAIVLSHYLLYTVTPTGDIVRTTPTWAFRFAMSRDTSTFASVSSDFSGLRVTDIATGVARIHTQHSTQSLAVSPDGKRIASIHNNLESIEIHLWSGAEPNPSESVRAWLDRLTNASLDDGVVTWH